MKATALPSSIKSIEMTRNKLSLKRAIIYVTALLIAVASFYAWHLYNKPVESMEQLETDFVLNAAQLQSAYEQNEVTADKHYLSKVIEVSGVVQGVEKDAKGNVSILLETNNPISAVSCAMDAKIPVNTNSLKVGSTINVKGFCSGYLNDVVMVRCIILN